MAYPWTDVYDNGYLTALHNLLLALFNGNEKGACAVLGNWYVESKCDPNRLQGDTGNQRTTLTTYYTDAVNGGTNIQYPTGYSRSDFINDSKGYGLAQWTTSSRKADLYDYYGSNVGVDSSHPIESFDRQWNYFKWELNSRAGFTGIIAVMSNTNTSLDDLTDYFRKVYEGTTSGAQDRRDWAETFYNHYSGSTYGYTVSVIIVGNGDVTVNPLYGNTGDLISLIATPKGSDSFTKWEVLKGNIVLNYNETISNNSLYIGSMDIILRATFTGDSYVPPTTKIITPLKKMPIWMYPLLRK